MCLGYYVSPCCGAVDIIGDFFTLVIIILFIASASLILCSVCTELFMAQVFKKLPWQLQFCVEVMSSGS